MLVARCFALVLKYGNLFPTFTFFLNLFHLTFRNELKVCFKTDFEARPVYLQDETRIKAHFLICFLSLAIYRYLEKSLGSIYTCETILDKLKTAH